MRTGGIRKERALLVRTIPWGERDRLAVLFAEQAGRIQAKAVSAMETGSRMAPLLIPPALGEFALASGHSGIPVLTGAEIDERFPSWKRNARRLGAAGIVLAVLDGMEAPAGQNRRMFALAVETLRAGPGQEPLAPVCVFLASALDILGLAGGEAGCSICGKELSGKVAVAAGDLSAFFCARCFNREYGRSRVDAPTIPTATLRLLAKLKRMPPAEAHEAGLAAADIAFVLNLAMHRMTDLLPQASAALRRVALDRASRDPFLRRP
jgi:DNA repair protein RecO